VRGEGRRGERGRREGGGGRKESKRRGKFKKTTRINGITE
jgi:hypothetical protein